MRNCLEKLLAVVVLILLGFITFYPATLFWKTCLAFLKIMKMPVEPNLDVGFILLGNFIIMFFSLAVCIVCFIYFFNLVKYLFRNEGFFSSWKKIIIGTKKVFS